MRHTAESRAVLSSGDPNGDPRTNKSLHKALRMLGAFTESTPEWGVSDLARHLGVSKSSVSTMLGTLASFDLVHKSSLTGRYELGLRCLEMGYLSASKITIRDLAFPFLGKLLAESGRIVYMGIPYKQEVLYVEALYPEHRRINFSSRGKRAPLYCTGIGKALLAWLPSEARDNYLGSTREFPRHTSSTLTTRTELEQELVRTRDRGHAIDRQERELGIHCVAAPVQNRLGHAIAAVSLSGPSEEIDDAGFAQLGRLTSSTARDISRKVQISGY